MAARAARRGAWPRRGEELRRTARRQGARSKPARQGHDGDLPVPAPPARPACATRRNRPWLCRRCNGALPDEAATMRARRGSGCRASRRRCAGAFGRSRRRQIDAGARADPRQCRRPGAGGAEPDLHAGAILRGRVPVSHFDLYRLGCPSELDELGFDEVLGEGAAVDRMAGKSRRPAADAAPIDAVAGA